VPKTKDKTPEDADSGERKEAAEKQQTAGGGPSQPCPVADWAAL